MNKENIFVNIRELQKKISILDERLSDPETSVSDLDLDTQLMYLRLMYDRYLSLRSEMPSEVKKRGRGKKDIPQPVKEQQEEAETEERVTSLPLMFEEESEPVPDKKEMLSATENPVGNDAVTEQSQQKVDEPVSETAVETDSVQSEAMPDGEKAEEPVQAEIPEVDLNLLEEESASADLDMNAIEFEDEPDGEDEEDETPAPKMEEELYTPYYPGLNPKALEGEPETGYPTYSGKQPQTLGEHFANQFPSLNDQLSQKKGEDRSIAGRKQRDQINDLTKSIDLNLKFTFVRELFNGNAKLLTEELNNLNYCNRLEKALSLFEEMKSKYRWKEDSDAVQQLYELILRKFAH